MEDRYEVARQMIERAKKFAETYKGDCSECEWHRRGFVSLSCANPIVEAAALFTIDQGYDRERFTECSQQRSRKPAYGPALCGPEGMLFEQKEKSRRWL